MEGILAADALGAGAWAADLEEVNQKINDLTGNIDKLKNANNELTAEVAAQYRLAFDAAIEAGGELAEKLKELGGPDTQAAQELLRKEINASEKELVEMQTELEGLEKKLREDISNASLTASQKLEQFRDRAIDAAKRAGDAGTLLQPLINQLDTVIGLQKQLDNFKTSKDQAKYLDDLRERKATQGLTTAQKIKHDNRKRGLTGQDLIDADNLADQIGAGEQNRKKSGGAKAKYDAADKNQQLNIQ